MNQDKTTVAAVVTTYNRKQLLRECLQALLAQTRPVDEIIVVDNASTDGTSEMLAADCSSPLEVPEVTVLRLSVNLGGAGGFARGIQMAYEKGYDWIWVMDDDAIAEHNALENSLANITQNVLPVDKVGALQSAVYNYKERLPWGTGWLTTNPVKALFRGVQEPIVNYDAVREAHFMPFVGALINSKVIEAVGVPREDFFVCADDLEYAVRMRQASFRICVVPESIIWHKQQEERIPSRNWKSPLKMYYGYRNNIAVLLMHSKTIGSSVAIGGLLYFLHRGVGRALASWIAGRKDITRAVWLGIRDGLTMDLGHKWRDPSRSG